MDKLSSWQPGLKSFKHLSGDLGRPGARTRLVYDENGRKIEMIETVLSRDLPDTLAARYEARGVDNVVANHFHEDEPGRTRWVTDNTFKMSGIMAVMSLFMGGAFRKQTLKHMQDFKRFAESTLQSKERDA